MSDYMEYAEYYKKAWEHSLKERTNELQAEINRLKAENARYREALEFYADEKNEYEGVFGTPESPQRWEENPICYYEKTQYRHLAWWKYDRGEVAREALKVIE